MFMKKIYSPPTMSPIIFIKLSILFTKLLKKWLHNFLSQLGHIHKMCNAFLLKVEILQFFKEEKKLSDDLTRFFIIQNMKI